MRRLRVRSLSLSASIPRRLLVHGVSASAFVLYLLEAETTRAIRAGDNSLVNRVYVYAWRRLRVRSLSLSASISPRRLLVLGVSASAFVLYLLETETNRAIQAGDSIVLSIVCMCMLGVISAFVLYLLVAFGRWIDSFYTCNQ